MRRQRRLRGWRRGEERAAGLLRLAATAPTSLRSAVLNRMSLARAFLGATREPGREPPSASKILDLVRADTDQIDPALRANGSGPKWRAR
jgi:hypothetical protein